MPHSARLPPTGCGVESERRCAVVVMRSVAAAVLAVLEAEDVKAMVLVPVEDAQAELDAFFESPKNGTGTKVEFGLGSGRPSG